MVTLMDKQSVTEEWVTMECNTKRTTGVPRPRLARPGYRGEVNVFNFIMNETIMRL